MVDNAIGQVLTTSLDECYIAALFDPNIIVVWLGTVGVS